MSFNMIILNQSIRSKNILCYMGTDSFIVNANTEEVYKDITNDVENTFDTSNYKINTLLPMEKMKMLSC